MTSTQLSRSWLHADATVPRETSRVASSISKVTRELPLKVVLVGARGAGVTSLIRRYVSDRPPGEAPPSLGIETSSLPLPLDHRGASVLVQLTDVAAPELHGPHRRFLLSDAAGVVLVVDEANPASFAIADAWRAVVAAFVDAGGVGAYGQPPAVFLAVTKHDLAVRAGAAAPPLAHDVLDRYSREANIEMFGVLSAVEGATVKAVMDAFVAVLLRRLVAAVLDGAAAAAAATTAPSTPDRGSSSTLSLTPPASTATTAARETDATPRLVVATRLPDRGEPGVLESLRARLVAAMETLGVAGARRAAATTRPEAAAEETAVRLLVDIDVEIARWAAVRSHDLLPTYHEACHVWRARIRTIEDAALIAAARLARLDEEERVAASLPPASESVAAFSALCAEAEAVARADS